MCQREHQLSDGIAITFHCACLNVSGKKPDIKFGVKGAQGNTHSWVFFEKVMLRQHIEQWGRFGSDYNTL